MKTNKFKSVLFLHSILIWTMLFLTRIADTFSVFRLKSLGALSYAAASIPFAAAVKSGVIATTDRVNIDVVEPLYSDRPKEFGLMTMMDKLKRNKTKTTNTKGFEERMSPDVVVSGAAVNTTAVSTGGNVVLPVATGMGKHFYAGQTIKLLLNTASGWTDVGRVQSVSGDNVTVKPINTTSYKFGAYSNAAGIPAATRILLTGNANEELAKATLNPIVLPNRVINNTQTIRHNFMISKEGEMERVYGVDEIARLSANMHYNHAREIYKSLLFNGSSFMTRQGFDTAGAVDYTQNTHLNYSQGIEATLLANSDKNVQYTAGSDLYASFSGYQFNLFDLMVAGGTDTRLALANKAAKKFFTDQKKNKGWYIFNNDEFRDVFGIPGVKTVETDQGKFDLLVDGIVDRVYTGEDLPYIMGLHLRYVELKDFLKTMQRTNIQDNDVLGRMDECVSIFTNLVFLPEAHGIWRPSYTNAIA